MPSISHAPSEGMLRPGVMPSLQVSYVSAAVLAAAVLVAAVPASTDAAGFGTPRTVSVRGGIVSTPQAVVAPNGRTAVLWEERNRDTGGGRRYRIAIGPSPNRLGPARTVGAGLRAARTGASAELLALPNGGFAVCFGDLTRTGRRTPGCAFASPKGGVGRLRPIAAFGPREAPSFAVAARPDGRLALLVSRRVGDGRMMTLRTGAMTPSGRITGSHALATVRRSVPFDIAATNDGTVAVSWSTGPSGVFVGDRTPVLRFQLPASDRFGPAVPFTPESTIDGGVGLQGGRSLLLSYSAGSSVGDGGLRVVRRTADGTFEPPMRLPAATKDGAADGAVVQLPDGTPFAVTTAVHQPNSDCGAIDRGIVGAGPLVDSGTGPTAERLSAPRQIAIDPGAAVLRDGTVIATWGDATGDTKTLEVALRTPRANRFSRPQVLPLPATRTVALAAGGNHAVLAWVTGSLPDGPARVVVSGLRRTGPYAPPTRRPTQSIAPCL